ncbi:MAG: carboxypeptidase regulatory-like domain-containing protein, partial [Gemmatimonadaceae bacterium]
SDGVRHLSLHVGEAIRIARSSSGRLSADPLAAARRSVLRGEGHLNGTARDSSGKPVPNAEATVWDTGREGRTNARGVFALDSLPGGTHMLEVKALGYAPSRMIVNLASGRRASAHVVLTKSATELAAVNVTAKYSRHLAEFERHRRGSIGGHFIPPAEIEGRPLASMGRLIQGLPGIIVRCRSRGCEVSMRRAATYLTSGIEECSPTVYVDGRKSPFSAEDVDIMMSAQDIAAIEVYARPVERPAEFIDPFNKCGVIAIWTKPFEMRSKQDSGRPEERSRF